MRQTAEESLASYTQSPSRLDRLVDWRRLLVFAGGGVVLLLLMLSIADRAKERAAAAAIGMNQDTPFSPWVGEWTGSLQTGDTNGIVVAHETVTRKFGPFDGLSQGIIWSAASATGPSVDRHGTQEYDNRILIRSVASDSGPETYTGWIDVSGTITWRRETDRHLTMIREWVDGTTYYVEGFTLDKGKRDGIVFHTGRLRRQGKPQTTTK